TSWATITTRSWLTRRAWIRALWHQGSSRASGYGPFCTTWHSSIIPSSTNGSLRSPAPFSIIRASVSAWAMPAGCATRPRSSWQALTALFDHFTRHGAKACAISLPPDFVPGFVPDQQLSAALRALSQNDPRDRLLWSRGVFWMLAEHCRTFRLPFDLMIGVNR